MKTLALSIILLLGLTIEAQTVERTNVQASITFAWNPVANATGYRFYWGPSSGVYTNAVSVGNTTSYTVTNIVRGATNYYTVTALSAVLESPYSNEVKTNTAPLPAAPTIVITGSQ